MSNSFEREELISLNQFKNSTKEILDELFLTSFRLGLIHNDKIRAVILDIHTYEKMINHIKELEDMNENQKDFEELENRLQVAYSQWIEKPSELCRINFLKQSLERTNTT